MAGQAQHAGWPRIHSSICSAVKMSWVKFMTILTSADLLLHHSLAPLKEGHWGHPFSSWKMNCDTCQNSRLPINLSFQVPFLATVVQIPGQLYLTSVKSSKFAIWTHHRQHTPTLKSPHTNYKLSTAWNTLYKPTMSIRRNAPLTLQPYNKIDLLPLMLHNHIMNSTCPSWIQNLQE